MRLLSININRLIISLIILFGVSPSVEAAITLSVTPFEGGRSLRFGSTDITERKNKEVRVRITSTDATRYQIYHRLQEVFVNDRGIFLDRSAFSGYSLTGSNASGTLYQQDIQTVTFSDDLLYSSNQSGSSDTFLMIYQVDPAKVNGSGRFLGKMIFTLRPVGGGAQQEAVLDVFLDAHGQLKFMQEGSSGRDRVRIHVNSGSDSYGYFKISYQGNVANQMSLFQDIQDFPADEDNNEICRECLEYQVSNTGQISSMGTPWQPVKYGRKFLFSTNGFDDEFFLEFRVNKEKIDQLTAGTYRARFDFSVESDQIVHSFPVDMEIAVDPIFELDVQYPEGGLNFKNLLPETPPQIREVDVRVRSNLGRAYMITSNVISALTNEKGDVLPNKYFRMKQTLLEDSNGKVEFPTYREVKEGDNPIYFSDRLGSSVLFKVQYELRSFRGIEPGSYSTQITYSLGER